MANGNGNGRLKALENAVFQDKEPELTPAELREDFIYTLFDHTGRNLAYKLPHELGGRMIEYFNSFSQPWLPPVTLAPDDLEQFDELAWTSRLYLAALLAMVQGGLIEGDPGALNERIIELIATDTPDLGRTSSDICPWQMTWQELLDAQRAAGYGVYGPKPGCNDNQNKSGRLSVEYYWISQVNSWLKIYGSEIVGEFIPLKTVKILEG